MQVKFRGKRKGGNEWLIGDLSHVNGGTYIIPTEDALIYIKLMINQTLKEYERE